MQADWDEQYIKSRCSGGDRHAFTLLYSYYYKPLYRHIFLFIQNKETTEEILQNVFVKIWENRTSLNEIGQLKPYLYRTARNMLLNHLRKMNTEKKVLRMRSATESISENPTSDLIDSKDYKRLLQEALGQLTEKRKEIFLLRMEENLSLDEIASRLSISKNVVKKQLYAAIAFIREYIHRQGGISAGLLMVLIRML
ncbi:RNA polymerase sigma factor [Pseudoflavitalea rhizosphaerae]|uniref:RNA polymerase sigma factor n=1 Tax=Pseudoflavitalea rhizosphaerae TaxID=1884793 RepID=UPI000F8E7F47|nr:RNA polymerase sigma-70 factor [Pseudoflavitalea rhizosphaerae]